MTQSQTGTQRQPVSLNPETFVSGGLVDHVNAEVKGARFEVWDYQGKGRNTLALKISLMTDDGDEADQYYSAGDPKAWQPSADGKGMIPMGSQTAPNQSSNFAFFMDNLVNAGFPKNRIGPDISVLEGLYGFWERVNGPERTGITRAQDSRSDGKILIVTTVHSLPGEKKASQVAGQAKGKDQSAATAKSSPAPAPASASENGTDDLTGEVVTFLQAVLGEKSPMAKKEVMGKVFSAIGPMAGNPRRNEVAKALNNADFLAELVGMGIINLNGDEISLA